MVSIKYLGVTIDARLLFKEHFLNAGLKASNVARALAGIMPNIGGPKQPRRALLSSVVRSVILYGAPIRADALHSNMTYEDSTEVHKIPTNSGPKASGRGGLKKNGKGDGIQPRRVAIYP